MTPVRRRLSHHLHEYRRINLFSCQCHLLSSLSPRSHMPCLGPLFSPLLSPPPYAHPLVYLDLDCCWSSLVARRCPLACLSWLLVHMEPSLTTCTFIVPLQADLLHAYCCLCHRVHTSHHSLSCLAFPRPRPCGGHLQRRRRSTDMVPTNPHPTNPLISFLVLPNLTSFLYHSSFLELCSNLCCLFSFFFLAHATKIPLSLTLYLYWCSLPCSHLICVLPVYRTDLGKNNRMEITKDVFIFNSHMGTEKYRT
ncbi:hypothetical protein EDB85DRAFT_512867 [Lactarius pseudohatsudake]|nr:hypothetical protein EDB85DRAFT_512867 [Lactarius pseudohatsudake]